MARLVMLLILSLAGFYYYHNKSDVSKNVASLQGNVSSANQAIGKKLSQDSDINAIINKAIDDFNNSNLPDANRLLNTLEEALNLLEKQIANLDKEDKEKIENILNDLSLRASVIDSSLLDSGQKLRLASLEDRTIKLLKEAKNS